MTTELDLRTERLTLHPIDDTDMAALVRHWGDAQVRRYLWDDTPISYDIVSDVVTTSNRDFDRAGFGVWAVRLQGEQELIGVCGMRGVQGTDWVEILYSVRPRYWGKGYATEAAAAVLGYAFEQLGLETVFACFDDENSASSRVLRRLGMRPHEGPTPSSELRYWSIGRERYRGWSIPPAPPPAANS